MLTALRKSASDHRLIFFIFLQILCCPDLVIEKGSSYFGLWRRGQNCCKNSGHRVGTSVSSVQNSLRSLELLSLSKDKNCGIWVLTYFYFFIKQLILGMLTLVQRGRITNLLELFSLQILLVRNQLHLCMQQIFHFQNNLVHSSKDSRTRYFLVSFPTFIYIGFLSDRISSTSIQLVWLLLDWCYNNQSNSGWTLLTLIITLKA